MATQVGLRQRIHDRLYGDVVDRWRAGTIDDRQFSRAYRLRAQKYVPLAFVVPFALAVVGDWLERDISPAEHLERVGNFALMFGIFWLAIAAVIDGNARFGVRDMRLRRDRDAAERQQQSAQALTPPVDEDDEDDEDDENDENDENDDPLVFGSYTRTTRYWNRVLLRMGGITALMGLMATWSGRAVMILFILVPVVLWALIARFDRRPYVDISEEGIWCRAWGNQRLAFSEFKAAYPRKNSSGELGVVLVPHAPAALAPKLSWQGRYAMRWGDHVPAHAGTVTLWTSKVGLDQHLILRALQAELGPRRS